MVDKKDKNLIGAAGEHLVLSRLLSKGMLAAQAPIINCESPSIFSEL
jgi:hypothetical protein